MSQDSYTEVTSTSWFGRLGNAFKGIVTGIVLFLASFVLLFMNEKCSFERASDLAEMEAVAISIPADTVSPANEGKAVHTTGLATTTETLNDPIFPVSAQAISLIRTVEMYQWKETTRTEKRKKLGGGEETVTTYDYSKVWSASVINSTSFKIQEGHQNPSSMPYESDTTYASNVTLGAFTLPQSLVQRIGGAEAMQITEQPAYGSVPSNVKVANGGYYVGYYPNNPEIGDVRITFAVVKPAQVSLLAVQSGNSFAPFVTSRDGKVMELNMGTLTMEEMFASAKAANRMFTWLKRLGGFILMFVGISMILKPLSVVMDVIPFLGNIVEMGTGIIAFLIALVLSTTTIAIAWLFYRPLIGILILLVAVAGVAGIIYLKKKKSGGQPAAAAAPPPPPSA